MLLFVYSWFQHESKYVYFLRLSADFIIKKLPFLTRIPDLQGEGEATSWGSSGGHLQLRPAPLHPYVLGEGGGKESPRGLSVRQVQVHHQPGCSRRRHPPGPAGGHAPPGPTGGRAGHSAPAAVRRAGGGEPPEPPARTQPAGSG